MNRLKSNCSAKSSTYTLFVVRCLSLLFRNGHACTPNPCTKFIHEATKTSNANMRYPKSLTPRRTVAISSVNYDDVNIAEGGDKA